MNYSIDGNYSLVEGVSCQSNSSCESIIPYETIQLHASYTSFKKKLVEHIKKKKKRVRKKKRIKKVKAKKAVLGVNGSPSGKKK